MTARSRILQPISLMLTQAFKATLAILLFRSGPQDFPYSENQTLTRVCILLAVLSCTQFFSFSTMPVTAVLTALVAVGGVAMFVRVMLRLRKLEARFTQTLNALLLVGAFLLLVMRLPMIELMPPMTKWIAEVTAAQTANPTAVLPAEQLQPELPTLPALLYLLLSIWFLAVSAYIFRQAANLGFAGGASVALLCQFNVTMLLVFTAPLVALIGG